LEVNTFQIVEGQYLRDILDQPRALAATLEQLEIPKELSPLASHLREGKIKRVVLTGIGASFHALHPLFLRLNECGYTAIAVETSELVHSLERWFEPQTLIIAVSQSGQSAESVRLIEQNRIKEKKDRAPIVAVTNTAGSPLALGADAAIITAAGKEFSVSCKTYVTALMALHLLGGFLCRSDAARTRDELAQTVPAVASYLREWKEHVFEMAAELGRIRHLFLLGRGASLAASGAGALIIKESVRLHAEGMSGAAFRHGPLEMVNGETFAVVLAGAESTRPLQARLRDDIHQAGGKTGWIAEDSSPGAWNLPQTPPGVRYILGILPVQMMTLALAAQTGIEAGRFARIPKITTTE
jgi:glutamine---fructose-6-phosphate transaminase (isomerizing)